MAKVANTAKVFNFKVLAGGPRGPYREQFQFQSVKMPEVEIQEVKHGDTNYEVKTAGIVTTGDAQIKKLSTIPTTDTWAWDSLQAAQDNVAGGGGLPDDYKNDWIVQLLSADNITVTAEWLWEGAWIKKIGQNDFDRLKSENVMEDITVSVDRCSKTS